MMPLFAQVRALAAGFGPTLRAHLSLALQDLQNLRGSGERPEASSRDLFQVLLQSLEEAWPCRFLLQEALVQRAPTLAVMAACQQVTMTTGKSTTFLNLY